MPARPFPLSNAARLLLVGCAVALLVACNVANTPSTSSPPAGASAPPTASPAGSPTVSANPTVAGIDHATGPTDVVLRLDQGGGFVPIDFLAASAPIFTLYGNGVIVFQPKVDAYPQPDPSGVVHNIPWRTATLDEGQIQELLEFALGPGGLGTARQSYIDGGIADAPSTIFTVHAGGLDKTVVVNALGDGTTPGPDAAARAAFKKVADRLSDFDAGGSVPTDVFAAARYRVVITERDPQVGDKPIAWPWPSITVSDFVPGANDGSGGIALPHRTAIAAEIDAIGIEDSAGGLQNVVVQGPDGKTYGVIVRPLLADEKD